MLWSQLESRHDVRAKSGFRVVEMNEELCMFGDRLLLIILRVFKSNSFERCRLFVSGCVRRIRSARLLVEKDLWLHAGIGPCRRIQIALAD